MYCHAYGCLFFPVASLKLLGMPLEFGSVKASLFSGILWLAQTVFSGPVPGCQL